MSLTTLPPLIGMLLTGLLLQNVGLVHIAEEFREVVSVLRYGSYHAGVGQAIISPIRHSVTTRVCVCVCVCVRTHVWFVRGLLDRSRLSRMSAGYGTAPHN